MDTDLIGFYRGSHPDHRGRLLAAILDRDDAWFEATHDYVQWLFPNREPSPVNPRAPVLTPGVVAAFLDDELLRRQLRASFHRMLAFYGLVDSGDRIDKSATWAERKRNWFTEEGHNSLRITRILKCLRSLGLAAEANRFHQALRRLRASEPDCGIGDDAFRFWAEAVGAPPTGD